MSEPMREGGEVKASYTLGQKIENFWYHYKWHTLIALFLLFVVTVCTLQMCNKESYDVYIMYAGDYEVSHRTEDGGDPPFVQMKDTLLPYVPDRDGNGKTTLELNTLYILTPAEIEAENERRRAEAEAGDTRFEEVNAAFIMENRSVFQSDVKYSDYYICILSPSMYKSSRTSADGTPLYAPLASYVTDTGIEYHAEDAVLLSSTALADKPVFRDMPEGTVICLRALSDVSAKKTRNREVFAAAEQALRAMLAP